MSGFRPEFCTKIGNVAVRASAVFDASTAHYVHGDRGRYMQAIHQILPNADDLLALEPEELAPVLLEYIASGAAGAPGTRKSPISRGNVFTQGASPGNGYPPEHKDAVNEALMAAWVWLEREGLLLPAIGQHDRNWVFVSERGRKLIGKEYFEAYKYSLLFPRKTLHPAISSGTFALFIRGKYDTVVFEAFRAVEVAVRQGGNFPATVIGTDLMRKAFAPNSGPLTDTSLAPAEQQATADLFAGSMGLFKNPTSHRADAVSKPEDAVALVMLADYLLRFVEQRVAAKTSGP
jgi:uncharacterized protein (TIGR02391 family)